ncbi:FAD-dependent oxidoreductase [Lentibacillus sp.]|uniref:FAD-dependent oxidoreductase n=1 Tax=Lentibacillus sp. TaxID=1925746 RepID=UPI002B4B89EE|nr:FAD-dependent oxidoreductase [Lentibacillus sp.]HLS08148.1 FAD-dependent oxidoreductase [Lentibacillus sp.]
MTQIFSPKGRIQTLERMTAREFDMLIIGGGITGAGLARDAALRGLKVALVEKEDFGFGTSSRSAKLVHGGVRYLVNGNVHMVKESARERKILKTIAPHLVHGSAIHDLIRYGHEDPIWLENLSKNTPAIKGEVRLAVEEEMAQSLIDFMDRRSARFLFGNDHCLEAAKTAAEIMGQFLGWDEAEIERQINDYADHVERHRIS